MKLLQASFEQQLQAEVDKNGNVIIGGMPFTPLAILKADQDAYEDAFNIWKTEQWLPEQKERLNQILEFDRNRKRFEDLCEEVKKENVIPFVGSGMSVPSGLPTWSDFLRRLCKDSKLGRDELEALLSECKFEEAVDALIAKNTKGLFEEGIEHELRLQNNAEIAGAVLLLPELFKPLVITTNLDNILEQVYSANACAFSQILAGSRIADYPRLRSSKETFLLKIHGDRTDHKSRVLSQKEYENAYRATSSIREEIELIVKTHRILFLGCSLGADRIVQLMGEIASKYAHMARHYAFLQKPSDEQERLAREHFLTDHGIFPIWYFDDHDTSIQVLLAGILQSLNKI